MTLTGCGSIVRKSDQTDQTNPHPKMKSDFAPALVIVAGTTIGLLFSGLFLNLQSKTHFDNCVSRGMSADYCSLTFYGR